MPDKEMHGKPDRLPNEAPEVTVKWRENEPPYIEIRWGGGLMVAGWVFPNMEGFDNRTMLTASNPLLHAVQDSDDGVTAMQRYVQPGDPPYTGAVLDYDDNGFKVD
jgi:hypothetical protein